MTATGGCGSPGSCAGATTIDQVAVLLTGVAVDVAAYPPALPAGTCAVSPTAAEINPAGVPIVWDLNVTAPGNVHPLLAELLSAQYDTSIEPSTATGTMGVARAALDVLNVATLDAVTAEASR